MEKIDVDYVAKLARLKLTDEEKAVFSKQLVKILEYIHKLDEIDTSNVRPTAHTLEIKNVFREDKMRDSGLAENILANAPDRDGPYFKVKKVIE